MTTVDRWEKPALAILLAGFAVLLVMRAWRVGVTVDEPSHLLSAHLYWQGEDRLQPRDMPPLIKLAGGWVSHFYDIPIPRDHQSWQTNHEWPISQEMIARMSPEQAQAVFFWSRLPMIVFPLAACWLAWHWARQLFSGVAALLIAFAFCLEPNAIGHGALFKNDLAATFGYLLFWYRAWCYWRDPRLQNAAWLGAGLLVALLSKLSMLVLIPCALLIVVARRRRITACLALALLIPYIGTLAAYQFETRRFDAADVAAYSADPAFPAPLIMLTHVFRVIPTATALWDGAVALLHNTAEESAVYMLGRTYPQGHWAYFLVALAVKVPAILQLLILAGVAILCAAAFRRKLSVSDLFWIAPPLLYIALASLSPLQLGIRLILPAMPFGLLIAGVALQRLIMSRRLILTGALFAFLVMRAAATQAHPLAFFNMWTGGPEHGLEYLADSNIDWGQGLRYLAEYVEEKQIPRIKLFYFGNDNPWRFFDDKRLEVVAPPWSPEQAQGLVFQPEPGYYAVSATLLPGHFFDRRYRDYFRVFREMTPIARAGYAIYIYKVPDSRL